MDHIIKEYSVENKIYIARVDDNGNRDSSHSGKLNVTILHSTTHSETLEGVRCIMPFGGKNSGIFGNKTPGSHVLVTQVCVREGNRPISDSGWGQTNDVYEWFWLGVVPETIGIQDPLNPTKSILSSSLPDAHDMYHTTNLPNKTIIKSTIGHKLILADKSFKGGNGIWNQEDYAQLRTNTNKQIKLDAGIGPGHDRIVIADEHGNQIIINSGSENKPGKNSMKLECLGNFHALTHTGEIDITAGKDSTSNISVTNRGTGNIHIQSTYGDVTVKAEKEISLQCDNVSVSANSNVKVIATNGDIDVTAAKGDISVEATEGDVGITAGATITLTASRIDMVKG